MKPTDMLYTESQCRCYASRADKFIKWLKLQRTHYIISNPTFIRTFNSETDLADSARGNTHAEELIAHLLKILDRTSAAVESFTGVRYQLQLFEGSLQNGDSCVRLIVYDETCTSRQVMPLLTEPVKA